MKDIQYVLREVNKYDGKILPYSAAIVLLGVAAPFAGVLLPKLMIDLLVNNAPPEQLLIRAGSYTILLAVLCFLNDFCVRNHAWRKNHIADGSFRDFLHKNLRCEYSYLESPEKQALFARLKQNVDSPDNCYSKTIAALIGIITGVLGFGLYSFVLAGLNLWIAILLTVSAAVNYIALYHANRFEHRHKDSWSHLERKIAYLFRVTGDYEYGKDIRLYTMKPWFVSLASDLFSQRKAWDNSVRNRYFASKAVNALTLLLRDGAAYALLIYRVTQGDVGVADFMLFFGAIAGFSAFVTGIIESVGNLGSALPYVKDIRIYLDGGRITEPDNPAETPDTSQPPVIEFRDVSFSYASGQKALHHLSFTIRSGEKLAIVGLNGAGKTTLIKLLCGFYTPDEGEILLYGIDIRRYRKKDLYALISAVFQDEFILPLTLAENITPHSGDEDGIRHALQRAGLLEHAETLPKGLTSLMTKSVRDDGVILSGGQNQKLFLARALYKDAPVLILDEPTAALDPIAEKEVYEKYHELCAGKTSIFISHRLASTRFCDRILLLGNGAVAETGSHDELMAQNGEYAGMYELQSHYYKEGKTYEAL